MRHKCFNLHFLKTWEAICSTGNIWVQVILPVIGHHCFGNGVNNCLQSCIVLCNIMVVILMISASPTWETIHKACSGQRCLNRSVESRWNDCLAAPPTPPDGSRSPKFPRCGKSSWSMSSSDFTPDLCLCSIYLSHLSAEVTSMTPRLRSVSWEV